MKAHRVWAVMGSMIVAAVVGTAGFAWACSPQATLRAPSTPVAPGESVTMRGELVHLGPAQLRWEGAEGPLLASVNPTDRQFSVAVTVPTAAAGVHYVVLVPPDGPAARGAVEVVATPGLSPATRAENAWTMDGPGSGAGHSADPLAVGIDFMAASLVLLSAITLVACVRRQRVMVSGERPRR